MEIRVHIETLTKILKLFEDKLKIDMNEIEKLKDKMNVQTLSVLFPGLVELYPDHPEKKILMNIQFKLPAKDALSERDFNLFLFSNIEIKMMEENKDPVCMMTLESYFNLMINSSS